MPLIPQQDFPFCGPTNLALSPILDAQESINLYPDPGIPSSKSLMGLTGRPGTSLLGSPGGSAAGHSLWGGDGRLFAAIGTHVYEVSNTGTVITDYGTGITGGGSKVPIQFKANGTQLLCCDSAAGKVFTVDPGGPALTKVFDGIALEYLDGFYISIAVGASLVGSNPNQINASINGNGNTWPGLSYVIRTGSADRTIQLAVLNSLLYIFGQKTIEIWYDAGANVFPFARVNGGTVNLGCLASQSVVKFSNTILWLGSDDTGYGQVYMFNGMQPVRVSTAAIEAIIGTYSAQGQLIYSKAYGYQEAGHTFYVLNLVSSGLYGTAQTLVYDLTTGLWHERVYTSITPTGFASVPNFVAFGSSLMNFIIEEATGKICYQGVNIASDNGAAIVYQRTAPHIGSENRWFSYRAFYLDIDPGNGNIAPILDYSNDGGETFNGFNYALTKSLDSGAPGASQRFYALQLGRSRDRVFQVKITESTNLIRIANAYIDARPLR